MSASPRPMTPILAPFLARCAYPQLCSQSAPRNGAEPAADAARTAARAERLRLACDLHDLACDLHDSVTQTLLSLHWTAQAVADLWDTQPALARAALGTLRHLAIGATIEMRALLLDLHDAVLEQQGLGAALEALCAVVRQRSGVHVELHVGEVRPLVGGWLVWSGSGPGAG